MGITITRSYGSLAQSYGVQTLSSTSVEVEALLFFITGRRKNAGEESTIAPQESLRLNISDADNTRAKGRKAFDVKTDEFGIVGTEEELNIDGDLFALEMKEGQERKEYLWLVPADMVEYVVGSMAVKFEATNGRLYGPHRFDHLMTGMRCAERTHERFTRGGDPRGD